MSKKPNLLLLHGWSMDHRSMLSQQHFFEPYFNVINIDRPGHGDSSQEPNLPTEHHYWLALARKTFAEESFHIVGVSQGARVGLRMAALFPKNVLSIAVHGAAVDKLLAPCVEQAIPLEQYKTWVKAGQIEQFRQHWLMHPMMHAGLNTAEHELLKKMLENYQGKDLINESGTDFTLDQDIQNGLKNYPGYIMVSTAEHEAAERKHHAFWLRDNVKGSDFVYYKGAGHLVNISCAEQFNADLLDFYQRHKIIN